MGDYNKQLCSKIAWSSTLLVQLFQVILAQHRQAQPGMLACGVKSGYEVRYNLMLTYLFRIIYFHACDDRNV